MSKQNKQLFAHEKKDALAKVVKQGRISWTIQTPKDTGTELFSSFLCEIEPGNKCYPAHYHPYGDEIFYIVSGHGKIVQGDEKEVFELYPGVIGISPKDVPHLTWNTGDDTLKLLCIFAPGQQANEPIPVEDYDFPELQ